MAKFKKVDITIKFSLSVPADYEFTEIVPMLNREQWQFLLDIAGKRNMSASRPEISATSTSKDDDGDY